MANQYRSVLASGGASTGGDALPSEVLAGKTFTNDNGAQTGTMTNNGAVSQTLSAGQSYTIPEGYHNGNGTVTASDSVIYGAWGPTRPTESIGYNGVMYPFTEAGNYQVTVGGITFTATSSDSIQTSAAGTVYTTVGNRHVNANGTFTRDGSSEGYGFVFIPD